MWFTRIGLHRCVSARNQGLGGGRDGDCPFQQLSDSLGCNIKFLCLLSCAVAFILRVLGQEGKGGRHQCSFPFFWSLSTLRNLGYRQGIICLLCTSPCNVSALGNKTQGCWLGSASSFQCLLLVSHGWRAWGLREMMDASIALEILPKVFGFSLYGWWWLP